jgi:F-type H+-transporting ATPase subunit a
MLSPISMFELFVLKALSLYGLIDISLTNAVLYLFIAVFTFIFGTFVALRRTPFFLKGAFSLGSKLYFFVADTVIQQCGNKGIKYLPIFFTVFILVLLSNLIGIIPFSFTPTSNFSMTLYLALSLNLGFVIIGFYENGLSFLMLFVPKGGPLWLKPLLIIIELFSYLLRPLSLSIRLFANMMAGHILLHILASFLTKAVLGGMLLPAFLIYILLSAVILLEIGIAFLQAYVFLVLTAIYVNDSFHPSH